MFFPDLLYWVRTDDVTGAIAWFALCLFWWSGGWLLSTHAFRLRAKDRLLTGLAIGLLLFIVMGNLFAHLLAFPQSAWAGGISVTLIGLTAAWRSGRRPLVEMADLRAWPQLLFLAGLTIFFALINRGLAIFDDYHNLPLVSTMAAGDVPPHFFLNPENRLAFHYGLHLQAASLVRIAGFTPWSAFDLSKAFSLALSAVLAWIWYRRATGSPQAGVWGSLLAILGGGTRWLLLLLPAGAVAALGANLQLLGTAALTGPDLAANLTQAWIIEGDGPIPFPFALANGIFPPQVMALGAAGALPAATLYLMLILGRRRWAASRMLLSAAVFGLLLASLTLTAEHVFVLIWGGISLAVLVGTLLGRHSRPLVKTRLAAHWGLVLGISAILALTAGGVLTEVARRAVYPLWAILQLNGGPAETSAGFSGFGLRWPPAMMSAHLGSLSLTQPGDLLIALTEIGLVVFLAPWVTWWAWRRFLRLDWLAAGLALAAIGGFLLPIVIVYLERDRDITRLTAAALLIWMALGFPLAWFAARRGSRWRRLGLGAAYAVTVFGGLAIAVIQLSAIPRPQYSYFVDRLDVLMSRNYWNTLEDGAQVFDPVPYRAITLFGRAGGEAFTDLYEPLPAWASLAADPDPERIARAGYTYVYLDNIWWQMLTREERQPFRDPCAVLIAQESGAEGQFRRLLDVQTCGHEG